MIESEFARHYAPHAMSRPGPLLRDRFELLKSLFLDADELCRQLRLMNRGDVADAVVRPASLEGAVGLVLELLDKRGLTQDFLLELAESKQFVARRTDIVEIIGTAVPESGQEGATEPPRILLLADLQIGMESTLHREATASLPAAICRAVGGQRLYGVFMLGDLVWSGRASEYDDLRRLVLDPLRTHPSCHSTVWYAVPGNHDIDCDRSYVPVWELLGPRRQVFFTDSDEGREVRRPRTPSFAAFERFVTREAIRSPAPSERVASAFELPFAEDGVELVLVNTSWFSDKNFDTSGRIPAPTQALIDMLDASTKRRGLVVLGHHPIDAFRIDDRTRLRKFLREHRGLYLHGHVASPWLAQDNNVLREVGLGARTRAAGGDPFVSSMFAIVSLGQEVDVQFHRWEPSTRDWHEVTDLAERKSARDRLSLPWRISAGKSADGPEFEVGPLTPRVDGVTYLGVPSVAEWKRLLQRLRLVGAAWEPREQLVSPHEVHFFEETTSSRKLIVCLAGSGRVLSESEILEASNKLDLADYDSYTIFTFGELADEALAAYERLAERKALRVLFRHKIVEALVEEFSPRTRALIRSVDPTQVHVRLVFCESQEYILMSDSVAQQWIELYDVDGVLLPDTHAVVVALRTFKPTYGDAFYGRDRGPGGSRPSSPPGSRQAFDEHKYREGLFEEFNSVRYAPLAALGLGFSRTTLTDLYVDTSAQMEETPSSDAQLVRALDEIMESVEIDAGLREQLRHGLRGAFGVDVMGESDIARRLYQKHGSVLVLGNPGSGKTFFAKHQLLAYCRPPANDPGWYARHLPVYVPLAEAAKHLGDSDLLDIASALPKRSSLAVPARELRELYAEGRLALFLDGLDEVTSLAQRGQIAEQLRAFLDKGRASGNRFVMTSRPSAVQVVRIAPDLPSMTLCGLDERQIRLLTQRVLRAHVSEGVSGPRLSLDEAESHHARLVDQLLDDIHNTPGVRRLATNPLLLTLLIMVYMNSGAPSAKRHRIYHQGAQTLITIRGRSTGQPVLSESDLRRRLGTVALEVFRGHSTIPSMNQVLQIMARTLSSEYQRRVPPEEVERYLRQIADATGIIVLHPDARDPDGGHVTFMHYSFAEYYAALGLEALKTPLDDVARMAQSLRWKEVITLYAGLLGEFGDHLKAFIDALLRNRGPMDHLTLESLLFAFDCALESDVPPDAVQESLLRESRRAMGTILRFDRDLRGKLAERLGRLYAMSRSRLVVDFLRDGLARANSDERAAYVEMFARVLADEHLNEDLLTAFTRACDVQELPVFRAMCRTAQYGSFGHNLIRSPALKKLLEGALSRTLAYQLAALQCIEQVPPLSREFQTKVESKMRSQQAMLAASASRAFVEANTSEALDDELYRHKLLEALRNLAARGTSVGKYTVPSAIDRRVVERFLSSHVEADRELGVYLLPWLRAEGAFVRERLMEILRATAGEHVVAALCSLRIAEAAVGPLRLTEMAEVRRRVDDPHRDVRVAAVRALAELGKHEHGTLQTLIGHARRHDKGEEFREAVHAMVRCGHDEEDVLGFVAAEIRKRLAAARREATHDDLFYLLECASHCDWTEDIQDELCQQMKRLMHDPRIAIELRVHCLTAFSVMCRIDAGVIDHFVGLLEKRQQRKLRLRVPGAALSFLQRCRYKLNFINLIYPKLSNLQQELGAFGDALAREKLTEQEVPSLVACRDALAEIGVIVHALGEFDTPVPRE